MSVNEKMTTIANEIRKMTEIKEAIGLDAMASNLNQVNGDIELQEELLIRVIAALEEKLAETTSASDFALRKPNRIINPWEQREFVNAYMIGEIVIHNGIEWINEVEDNLQEPGIFGWVEL